MPKNTVPGKKLYKAIKVDDTNREMLIAQFGLDDDELDDLSVETWVVSGFGESALYLGILHKVNFDGKFVATGKDLHNGFVEVVER